MKYTVLEQLSKTREINKGTFDDICNAIMMARHYSHFTKYRYSVKDETEKVICVYRNAKQVT